jgi:glucokinase
VDQVLADLYLEVNEALAAAGGASKVAGVGIASPGPLDPWTGIIHGPPNLPSWDLVPIKRLFEERFGIPAVVGNDANVAALGEHRFGAGRGTGDMVYLTVSTGIGGGVIAEGRLLLGADGFAAELGHMTIDMRGVRCGCGNLGCLEALASGIGIARRARDAVQTGERTALAELPPGKTSAADVIRSAYAGDEVAARILREAGEALGVGVVNLAHIFNPRRIAIGGGVGINGGAILWNAVHETVRARAMMPIARGLEVLPAELGDDAGLIGTVSLVLDSSGIR